MVFGFLKKIFGSEAPAGAPGVADGSKGDVQAFVAYVVKSLVDAPNEVGVTVTEEDGVSSIMIRCNKSDIGKVIGKRGRTIAAIRCLVAGSTAHAGQRVRVEVED